MRDKLQRDARNIKIVRTKTRATVRRSVSIVREETRFPVRFAIALIRELSKRGKAINNET